MTENKKKKEKGVGLPEILPGMIKGLPPKNIEPQPDAKENFDAPGRAEAAEAAPKISKDDEAKILNLARKRYRKCISAESDNRSAALEDLKFKAGDQWPAEISYRRNQEKRPCLTVNTIPALTHQVTNDIRQNRPAINVSPIGNKSDVEGAKAFQGMINGIERDSMADVAYDTAITSAADIGFGYVRVLTEYESPETDHRVIVIRRVRNSFTVHLDPERQEPDGSDAGFGFIGKMIDNDEFKDKYPHAVFQPWDQKGVGEDYKDWITKDSIRVEEYFTVNHKFKRLVRLSNDHIGFWDDLGDETKKQIADGKLEIITDRESEVQEVMWYLITAYQILDSEKWDGKWIPLIEFIGEEIDLQGKVIRSGLIRNAKDSQRMKNYWVTYKTELAALAPKTGYIIAEGQDEGYEQQWKFANNRSTPTLTYVPVVGPNGQLVPPPMRVEPPNISSAVVQAEQSAMMDIMATMGVNRDPAIHEMHHDESGKLLQERRRNSDMGSFHIADNAAVSMRHLGRVLIDLIPKTYDTKRVITILQEDDTEERVTIDPSATTPISRQPGAKDSAARKIFNPQMGKYGVTVTIGPSYATKRIEASEQMMSFAKALPEKGALIAHLIAKYSDWPGADECYRLLAKALPPNLLTPDMRDLPPQMQAFVQSLTSKISQLMAERVQMLKDLTDQKEDRAIRKDKIDKDFAAKLLSTFEKAREHALDFDQTNIQTAISATNDFHSRLAKEGFGGQNPAQPNELPVSPV